MTSRPSEFTVSKASLFRLLAGLISLFVLPGCASLQLRLHMDHHAAKGMPSVNALILSGSPGEYRLYSAVHAQGDIGKAMTWSPLGISIPTQQLRIELHASEQDKADILTVLNQERSGCQRTSHLLHRNLQIAEARILEWMPTAQWPAVIIHLVRDGKGMRIQRQSAGASVSDLTLYLGRPILEADNCSVQAMFASDIAELVTHELTHVASAQRFGKSIDGLSNEYLAYATQLCLRLEINGRIPFPLVSIPGIELDHQNLLKDEKFWTLVHNGTMGSSLAGFLIADSMRSIRFGARPLNTGDISEMNRICAELHRLPAVSVGSRQTMQLYAP